MRACPALLIALIWLTMAASSGSIFSSAVAAEDKGRTRLVVVLYPDDNDGRPGNQLFDRGLRSVLTKDSSDEVEIHSEFLDLSRPLDEDYPQQLSEFLRRKYANRKVDVVIAGMAPALDFALAHRDHIFPGVPTVFGAVDRREVESRILPPDVIGMPMVMDLAATLDLAIRLHPQTRRVFVVSGSAGFDIQWAKRARAAFEGHAANYEIEFLSGWSIRDLEQKIAKLPAHSLVYYLHVFQDADGTMVVPAEVLRRLTKATNAPIYSHVDSYVGRGVVGGRSFQWETEGDNAARLALRILAGEDPRHMGIQPVSSNVDLFDWPELQRWGISEANLPAGSIVRNRLPGVWDLYKWHITGGVTLCLLQGLTIAGLLLQRGQRAQAEQRFRLIVDAAPTGILMVDRNGKIVLANAHVEKFFGYRKAELDGLIVDLLMPERFRAEFAAQRDHIFASPATSPMAADRELFGQCKDGSEFPIEMGLSLLEMGKKHFVLVSVSDISVRRHAETGLVESQRELQTLTGRLLSAQEDERRRIARELHDDLSQNLVLFSVQMELLHRTPPDSPRFAMCIDELSTRVKQLSSTIHELSHQLHPFKLEQLGLVASIRGLCNELAESHGQEIEFIHNEVPKDLSHDLTLCLFRIVQEALWNVIKHSQARRARVELWSETGMLCLRIADDGSGFDPGQSDSAGGLGLVSMRERLRSVRGEILIRSRPTEGTRIDVSIPLLPVTESRRNGLQDVAYESGRYHV